MRQLLLILTLCILGCGSSNEEQPVDGSKYISHVFKLQNAYGKNSLYSYWVKYPTSQYGQTRFSIQPDTGRFKPTKNSFSFEDTLSGFSILGWSADTVKALCIISGENPGLLPYRKEVKSLNEWHWQLDYYTANAFGAPIDRFFDSLIYLHDKAVFIGKDTSLGEVESYIIEATKGQIYVPLGDTTIRVDRLDFVTTIEAKYNNGDTIRKPPLVGLNSYILRPKRQFNWKILKDFKVFVEQPFR